MRLRFRRAVIQNFKCITGDPLTLNFRIPPVGLNYVRGVNDVEPSLGSNGASKTTLWDSVAWCLYGKTADGLKNPDIKPWDGSKKTKVRVLVRRDKEPFSIIRTAYPNGLTVNGEDVGQEYIDKNIMSFNTFVHTILLGQGRPLFFDLRPQEKMNLFTEVLGLDRWESRSKLASETASGLERERYTIENDLSTARALIEKLKVDRSKLNKLKKDWDKQARSMVASFRKDLSRVKKKMKSLFIKVKKAKSSRSKINKALNSVRSKVSGLYHKRQLVHSALRKAELEVEGRKEKIDDLEKKLKWLHRKKTCPMCKQVIGKKDIGRHEKELISEIEELTYHSLTDDIGVYKREIKSLDKENSSLEGEENRLVKQADVLDGEIHSYSVKRTEYEMTVEGLISRIKEFTEEENPHTQQLKEVRSSLKEQIQIRDELKSSLSKLNSRYERTKFWVKGFKECRLYALEEVLSELHIVSNLLCPELGLDGWSVEYDVEKETKSGSIQRGLNVQIYSPLHKGPVKWESFSYGERQRLRLVGALALSETLLNHAGITSDLEFLDEPTRHLSMEGIKDLCEYLPARAKRLKRKTLYVDHTAVESSHFASVITVHRSSDGVLVEGL